MRSLRRITVLAVLVALACSACGGDGSGITTHAGKLLDTQVTAMRAAAARADRDAVTEQLAQIRASVDQLESDGDVSRTAAARIRRAAHAVESQLALLPAPTTTTTTTTTTTAPPDDDGKGRDQRGHDDKGPGKDRGRDEE